MHQWHQSSVGPSVSSRNSKSLWYPASTSSAGTRAFRDAFGSHRASLYWERMHRYTVQLQLSSNMYRRWE
ncbi:hypothetical protein C6341_g3135 [Phytophthora cactorum]|nr:hypothetical protein PC120_g8530 [Phytophthora cactorum]KAG3093742.1 hypothetical protein PC122_g6027 [Phytophthora cactorum]KAG3187646.1 hypothetical protein C6341_g3135 [Phytophthora cactorum]